MIAVLPRTADSQLVAAYRAGDRHAFDTIHERYSARLERFAHKILARSAPGVAEDVVQEAMLRASRALLRDDREIDLKPWLFRLTRNCALDELSRVKTGSVALDDEDSHIFVAAPASSEPERAQERRADVRELLEDIATLPEVQRHALLRRELDGQSHEEIASELGLSEGSTKSLVFRARANLIREREARTEDCEQVRMQLLEAADAHRRAKPQTLRHVAKCPACREFRRELKASNRAIAILDPGILLIGLGVGGGALKFLTGKGAAVKTTAAVTAGIAVAGVAVIGTQVFGPGDPSPVSVKSPAVPSGRLAAQQPVPAGTSIVRQTLEISAGSGKSWQSVLTCPAGLRVADLLPPTGAKLRAAYSSSTIVGESRVARIDLTGPALAKPTRVTVSVLCRRPTEAGSIRAADQRSADRPTHRVRVKDELLLVSPGGAASGSVRQGQPVTVVRTSGDWSRVVTDSGRRGWLPARVLAPIRP
jgi:RNA polymerase sigma factor (sigma-70 family)